MHRVRPADGDSVRGPAILHESRNLVVEGAHRVIAAVGVSDLITVDTEDALQVCHTAGAQAVRSGAGNE